jgi:hypothetical protein
LFRHLLVVLLAVQLTGISWLGLLAFSKARQTCRNVKQSGLAIALKQLPKGKGNCALCKKVRLARTQQAQQQHVGAQVGCGLPGLSPALLPDDVFLLPPADDNNALIAASLVWHTLEHSPLTPPPRA